MEYTCPKMAENYLRMLYNGTTKFFIGVSSTGIYCRPVCRAKLPKPETEMKKLMNISGIGIWTAKLCNNQFMELITRCELGDLLCITKRIIQHL